MERRFPIEGGGVLLCREEGSRWIIQCARPDDGRGLYKVWLLGQSGSMPLGALLPDQGCLRLHRVLSASELARQGCLPPVGGEIKLTFSFGPDALPKGWSREGSLARLFPKDPLLARTAEQVGAALIRRGKRRFQLAVPWDVRAPFPLHPLFCLAKTETLNGADYLVFSFDAAGTPLSPD